MKQKVDAGELHSYPIKKALLLVEAFRIFRVFFIIMSCSFFLGILWHIFVFDVQTTKFETILGTEHALSDNFRTEYFWKKDRDDSANRKMVKVWYFAITTLSTIGFGDYHPISLLEKCVSLIILLFGVTMFSFILGQLLDIIMNINTYYMHGRHKDLTKWISLLSKYNNGNPLSKGLIKNIENFFDYYWENNRMGGLYTETDNLFMR